MSLDQSRRFKLAINGKFVGGGPTILCGEEFLLLDVEILGIDPRGGVLI